MVDMNRFLCKREGKPLISQTHLTISNAEGIKLLTDIFPESNMEQSIGDKIDSTTADAN